MTALRIAVACLAGCGDLGAGLSTDEPGRRPPNWRGPYGDGSWSRSDELDRLADKHAKTHPTRISAVPVTAPDPTSSDTQDHGAQA